MGGDGAFEGKVAVITGAASGLGRGIADRFGAAGCRLVLADVEEAALAQATAELAAAGAETTAVPTDVSDAASMDGLAEAAGILHDGLLKGRFYVWTDDIFIESLRRRHAEIQRSVDGTLDLPLDPVTSGDEHPYSAPRRLK